MLVFPADYFTDCGIVNRRPPLVSQSISHGGAMRGELGWRWSLPNWEAF